MFTRKTPKLQAADKTPYTSYNPHTISLEQRNWPEVIKVISIDPGIRNLAIRVESRGSRSNSYPIQTLVFDKLHIRDDERKTDDMTDRLYLLVTNFLDQYLEIFKTCHIMIIERQLSVNYKCVRISQHIISYFMIHLKNLPPLAMIFEVDPKLKGKELGASTHLNERGLKQWSVDYCRELLIKRKDDLGLKLFNKQKKKDDVGDVTIQIESLFSYLGWPLTQEVKTLTVISQPKPSNLSPINLPVNQSNNKKLTLNVTKKN